MRHMWLCCLAICQFAIFAQAHFEPVEQFQPIWQKVKGLRHTHFCVFYQKLQLKEEKDPACCCLHVASQAAGTSPYTLSPTQATSRGYKREAADLGEDMELSSPYLQIHQKPRVPPQQGFASNNRILLQWHLQWLQPKIRRRRIFCSSGFFHVYFFFSK